MQSREQIVKHFREYLREAKAPHADARALYMWGSILRSDFNPDASDVDAVAICGSFAEESEIQKFRDDARTKYKGLARLNLRCLYICDLNGSVPRSELAQLIDPRLLLADFQSWIWIWGSRLTLTSFALQPPNLYEAYIIRLRTLKLRVQRCLTEPRAEAPAYVLKEAAHLIHLIHQLSRGVHPFSYADLESHSNSVTTPLSRVIPILRCNGWLDPECELALPLVLELLKQIDPLPLWKGYLTRGEYPARLKFLERSKPG